MDDESETVETGSCTDDDHVESNEPAGISRQEADELNAKIKEQAADITRFQETIKRQKRMLQLLIAISDPLKENHMFEPIKALVLESF